MLNADHLFYATPPTFWLLRAKIESSTQALSLDMSTLLWGVLDSTLLKISTLLVLLPVLLAR
jgi:hypothetical protein